MAQLNNSLTGSTKRLFKEFKVLGIDCKAINDQPNLFRHQTKSGGWLSVKGMMSQKLPLFSYLIADSKWWATQYMSSLGLPVPKTIIYDSITDAAAFIKSHNNVVVKPNTGAHGNGVSMNVSNTKQLELAIKRARNFDNKVIIQEQLTGSDIRLLLIGSKLISALERVPAQVIGDGVHTVAELVQIENEQNINRGIVGVDKFVKISVPEVNNYLKPNELNSVPPEGKAVRVVGPSNHSLGGSIIDVMQTLDNSITGQAEQIAARLLMPIAGIDCIITNIGPKFIEINASPGIGIHDDGLVGITSGCFRKYAQYLYELEP